MLIRKLKDIFFSFFIIHGLAFSVLADEVKVDLELILAVDVSNSVDDVEADWQYVGYTTAFQHSDVIAAIQSGYHGRIAVTYIEWAGEYHQYQAVDWMIIDGNKSADDFSRRLINSHHTHGPYTSISALIDFSRKEFTTNKIIGTRQVIDISGDGPNSDGRDVKLARNEAISEGIVINGLPVLSFRPNANGGVPAIGLDEYYEKNVIGGAGSFVIEANMLENFSVALVKKLVREIQDKKNLNIAKALKSESSLIE